MLSFSLNIQFHSRIFCKQSLLQKSDIQYIVEKIWSGQSVISGCSNLYDLVLSRWNPQQEWSPWNCILVTNDEAETHLALNCPETVRQNLI